MIVEDINKLRDELDKLILSNAPYEKIYNASIKIDRLLVDYYKQESISKSLA